MGVFNGLTLTPNGSLIIEVMVSDELFSYKTITSETIFMWNITFSFHPPYAVSQAGGRHFSPVDANNVRSFVGSERRFRIKLMLQHGEVGFRSIAA